ncbi:hypothetical protein SUGI_0080250 [Cryptomeria japonica]|nr:hypothetical protein SUGI_0080250 [Cryptomeria japonica]
MIAGYAQNGQQEEALEIFRQMERAGLKADRSRSDYWRLLAIISLKQDFRGIAFSSRLINNCSMKACIFPRSSRLCHGEMFSKC